MWEQLLHDNISEISTALITLFIACIKKKLDVRKWKKQGRLIDIKEFQKNGSHK